jgi:hypothetical protein
MSFTLLIGGFDFKQLRTVFNENSRRAEGGFITRAEKTSAFTVWSGDTSDVVEGAYSCTGTYAATLVAASDADAAAGRPVRIRNNGAGTITVTPDGSDTVDGGATLALAAGESVLLISDGVSDWEVY